MSNNYVCCVSQEDSKLPTKRLKRVSKEDTDVARFDAPVDLSDASPGEGSPDIQPRLDTKVAADTDTGGGGPDSKQELVHVAFTSDENTLIGTVAAVNSIWKNSKHPVKFLLVTNDKAYPLLK